MPLLNTARLRLTLPICAAVLVASCGQGSDAPTNTASLKDMEVVDGTTSDAMTDLDGVRVEGTALAPTAPSGNGSVSPSGASANDAAEEADNAEVLSDQ